MPRFTAALLALFIVFLPPAALLGAETPAPDFAQLEQGESGRAAEVVDGDTLVLDSGTEIRLVGIQAPKLPLGRPGFVAWPAGVTLYYGGARLDRYGRALAHLYRDDGLWLQGEMLARGLARVYSFADDRAIVPEMLAREGAARVQRLGIWRNPFYAVRSAEPATIPRDGYELVEGRVRDVATVRGRTYINFGDDWKSDFTLSLASKVRRLFDREGYSLESLKGLTIRARGWIKSYNGLMIELTHPEQIEIIDP